MNKTHDHFNRPQWGLSVWQGSAPHIGRSYRKADANLPVRANVLNAEFDAFKGTDVWNYDGWLVTSCVLIGGLVRCDVRRGTQVATLVVPDDSLFFHNNPSLPYEHYSAEGVDLDELHARYRLA